MKRKRENTQPKVPSWVAVAAHKQPGAGVHDRSKTKRNRHDRRASKQRGFDSC